MWLHVPASCLSAPATEGSILPPEQFGPELERSATWRGKPRASRFWQRAWRTAPWMRLLSGVTCPRSMVEPGMAQWISSWRGSPVSPSASPGSGSAPMTPDGCGEISGESSPSAAHAQSCSRTSPDSFPVTPSIAAYAAGIIDGEGCIGIAASRGYLHTRIDVGMTDKGQPILDFLVSNFPGGAIRNTRAGTSKWRAARCWTIFGVAAAKFLRTIRPYLLLKRQQATLALSIQDLAASLIPPGRTRATWTEAAKARALLMKERMHSLNQKGPSSPKVGTVAFLENGEWRAPQASLFDRSPKFSGPWPRSGSMRSGLVVPRAKSALPMNANGGSSWPMPTAMDSASSGAAGYSEVNRQTLTDATARRWPTATVSDSHGHEYSRDQGDPSKPRITLAGHGMNWSTPTVADADRASATYARGNPTLIGQSKQWLTPTTSDANGTRASREERGWSPGLNTQATSGRPDPTTTKRGASTQVLSPQFVETLMGLPVGWTDCGCWATASSGSKPQRRSASCSDGSEAMNTAAH
jgi:hypothetical protein